MIQTTDDSKAVYDNYSDLEIQSYQRRSSLALQGGQLSRLSDVFIKNMYVGKIVYYIANMLREKDHLKVCEIGCGNCINLMILHQYFPDDSRVKIYGTDISKKRFLMSAEAFGLKNVILQQSDVTRGTLFNDNHFDLVFTMHLKHFPHFVIVSNKN